MSVINKFKYYKDLFLRQYQCGVSCRGHQVTLHNWSRPFPQDMWLVDFVESRGLLEGRENLRVALYSVFGPSWLMRFDKANLRIFVERENLHKSHFAGYLHRFLDDDRVGLSLGFDDIRHPQYMRFPFWLMWTVFPPTVTYADVKDFVNRVNHIRRNPSNLDFCAYVCSHDDINRKRIYDEFNAISPLSGAGRLFHNDDRLKKDFGDDKIAYLSQFKFNLTPENSNHTGYVTEKLFEAISSGTVPIYQGSDNNPEPDIVNQDAIIFIELGKDNTNAVEMVKELHNNDKLYAEFSSQPRLMPDAHQRIWKYYEELESRLKEILRNL